MSAAAVVQPTRVRQRPHRSTAMPVCTVCAAPMIAAEASALSPDNTVSYLWSCDVCGYGFVTDYAGNKTPAPKDN